MLEDGSCCKMGEPVVTGPKSPVLKRHNFVASALVWSALNFHAQSAPTITVQPTSQTNLVGTSVTFSVTVDGTGPFTYQWQCNGINFPTLITTVAGNGTPSYSGDGGPATTAGLNNPCGVAFDAAGNLYISDLGNARIRKVDTNGIISTVAGNGHPTYAGDGGAATNASLSPKGVALDASGDLYITDTNNQRIRKVGTNCIISTVAGNGHPTYAGDGGAATNASLHYPWSVALDAAGNCYIADQNSNRVRKVDTNGIISTVAGNGSASSAGDGCPATNAGIYYPAGVALDAIGNLYIADLFGSRVRKVNNSGIISTVAGGGSGGDGGAATKAPRNNNMINYVFGSMA